MNRDGGSLPKVVALMPAWNAESFIVPVLESLAAQTYLRVDKPVHQGDQDGVKGLYHINAVDCT